MSKIYNATSLVQEKQILRILSLQVCSSLFGTFLFFKENTKLHQIKAPLMSAKPSSLLGTLINILEPGGRHDEMYSFCCFWNKSCCCRPTDFRERNVNTKQIQSADINKRKRGLCQGYRFLAGWDYFFVWWITADIRSQNAPNEKYILKANVELVDIRYAGCDLRTNQIIKHI